MKILNKKMICFFAGLSLSAAAFAAENEHLLVVTWGAAVPSQQPPAPINFWLQLLKPGHQNCLPAPNLFTVHNKGDTWSNPIKDGCAPLQVMVNNSGGQPVACRDPGGQMNFSFNGAEKLAIVVTHFTYDPATKRSTATCNVTRS